LKFAAAFVSQQDERTPIVLVISHQKFPVEKIAERMTPIFPSNFLPLVIDKGSALRLKSSQGCQR